MRRCEDFDDWIAFQGRYAHCVPPLFWINRPGNMHTTGCATALAPRKTFFTHSKHPPTILSFRKARGASKIFGTSAIDDSVSRGMKGSKCIPPIVCLKMKHLYYSIQATVLYSSAVDYRTRSGFRVGSAVHSGSRQASEQTYPKGYLLADPIGREVVHTDIILP